MSDMRRSFVIPARTEEAPAESIAEELSTRDTW